MTHYHYSWLQAGLNGHDKQLVLEQRSTNVVHTSLTLNRSGLVWPMVFQRSASFF